MLCLPLWMAPSALTPGAVQLLRCIPDSAPGSSHWLLRPSPRLVALDSGHSKLAGKILMCTILTVRLVHLYTIIYTRQEGTAGTHMHS